MGIRLFVEVLDHAPDTLTWRERHALSVLAENANDATRECWPGIEDDPVIAHRMRLPGRSSRYEVMKALRAKKALEGVSAGRRGHRAVYRIPVLGPAKGPGTPDAIGEKGSGNPGHGIREPRTQTSEQGPGFPDPNSEKGSGNDSDWVREPHGKGPGTPDPSPSDSSDSSASKREEPADHRFGIPEAARPLVDGITAAGVYVRWPFEGKGWFPVLSLISKSGVSAMVDHALKAASRTDVESANYFMKGWRELPPLPGPDVERPKLRPVGGKKHQPYAPPTDHSVYENGFHTHARSQASGE
ncbi:hypothetical protein [Streptomyces sp. NPDC055243]|uniref:hypothetical protein n=1 Tax=Streptomyces sp. NPDC055243 TaxID=3365720 RepID=UPI0037D98C0E